jgi:hypothetical protein
VRSPQVTNDSIPSVAGFDRARAGNLFVDGE